MTALFGPTDAVERARALREAGATGVFTFEGPQDVFTPLTLASTVGGLDLMTNVAIAFPRNPIQLAHQANDLQLLAEGRFTLGLGTQMRAQIEKRYGVDFDRPVARMKEMVGALRAIFAAWNDGERLDFRGEYYRHTLMTPTFNPGPNPFGPPPIYLGALGPQMTRATAEVADGLLVMPFGSKRFLHEVTMPTVRKGLAAAGRDAADFAVVPEIIVSVGEDHAAHARRCWRSTAPRPPTARCWTCTAGVTCNPNSTPCPNRDGGRTWPRSSTTRCCTRSRPAAPPPRWPRTSATGSTACRTGSASISPGPSPWRHWPRSSTRSAS